MNELHMYYLNIGSNIEPEINLPETISLLDKHGHIQAISNAWQSHPIGAGGPDFINACVLLSTHFDPKELKGKIIRFYRS